MKTLLAVIALAIMASPAAARTAGISRRQTSATRAFL
jgi:hypothetical protein